MIKLTLSYTEPGERINLLTEVRRFLEIKSVSKEYERKTYKEVYVKGEIKVKK